MPRTSLLKAKAKPSKASASKASLRLPNIIEAMQAPTLFGPAFRGESWGGWRTVLKATYALPLDEQE